VLNSNDECFFGLVVELNSICYILELIIFAGKTKDKLLVK